MRIVAYTAVQGVYAFVFIGVLRTIFDIAAACCRVSSSIIFVYVRVCRWMDSRIQ